MRRVQVTHELRPVLKDEQALLAEEASSRKVHLGHVAGDDMLQRAAKGAQATLEDADDLDVAAEVLELRVDYCYLSEGALITAVVAPVAPTATTAATATPAGLLLHGYWCGS